jgi:hypothetical protein
MQERQVNKNAYKLLSIEEELSKEDLQKYKV